MEWYNQPSRWEVRGSSITIQTEPNTDYWRQTSYGFTYDSGHFYYQTQQGNFQAEVQFSGAYQHLYDQAGLMVRVDAENWIKCGIEYLDGVQHISAVVTRVYSDWSIGVALPDNPPSLWLRLKREGDAVEVQYALDRQTYRLLRLAYFPPVDEVQVGLMCAAPQGPGFPVTFTDFRVGSIPTLMEE